MRTRPLSALFFAAVLANLVPVVWFSHLPSGDGPIHVYNASLFGRYFAHAADPIRGVLQFNWSLSPNLGAYGVLATLMTVMSPHTAERVFLAIYVVALPLSLRYAMRAVTRETRGVECLGLAVVFNFHFHWGFYNFIVGLVAYLFALGYWLRIREQPLTSRRLGAMAALVCTLYFCHPIPLFEFWLTAGCLWTIDAVRSRSWRAGEARQLVLASFPGACLCLHYWLARTAGLDVSMAWPSMRYAGSMLVKLFPLTTFTPLEHESAILLSAIMVAAVVWALAARAADARAIGLLSTSALLAAVVFVAPMRAIGFEDLITTRLVYFPLFLLLMWLATVKWPLPWAIGFAVAGIGVALIGDVSRWPIDERYDARVTSFLAMAESRDGRPMEFFKNAGGDFALTIDQRARRGLTEEAWGYVAADRRSVLLSDNEAGLNYYPFVRRAGVTPTSSLTLIDARGCALADGLLDESRVDDRIRSEISEVVWMDPDQPLDTACLGAYGKRIVAEQRSAEGTLVWILTASEDQRARQ